MKEHLQNTDTVNAIFKKWMEETKECYDILGKMRDDMPEHEGLLKLHKHYYLMYRMLEAEQLPPLMNFVAYTASTHDVETMMMAKFKGATEDENSSVVIYGGKSKFFEDLKGMIPKDDSRKSVLTFLRDWCRKFIGI